MNIEGILEYQSSIMSFKRYYKIVKYSDKSFQFNNSDEGNNKEQNRLNRSVFCF